MRRLCLLALIAFSAGASAIAAPVRVAIAAASNLVFVLEPLNAAFRSAHPDTDLVVATGASGTLAAQIRQGAPHDVFLSADLAYPQALLADGAAAAGTLTPFAIGQLVLWTTRPELDLGSVGIVVRNPAVHKIAIAPSETAPFGRAARAALEQLGVWADALPKLVTADNVAQAAQFVQSGRADAGFVTLSLVRSSQLQTKGRFVEVPAELYPPLTEAAVLTLRGAENPAARQYLAFLTTPEARGILQRFGYSIPAPSAN